MAGGTLNLNNTAQTVERLSGTSGKINLGTGHTLTLAPDISTTYSGTMAGPGAFTFAGGASTLTLGGTNTYTGATTVASGRLAGVTGGSCSNTTVTVSTGATNGVLITDNTKKWTCAALAYTNSGAALDFDYGYTTVPSTNNVPMLVTGTVDFTYTPSVSICGRFPGGQQQLPAREVGLCGWHRAHHGRLAVLMSAAA